METDSESLTKKEQNSEKFSESKGLVWQKELFISSYNHRSPCSDPRGKKGRSTQDFVTFSVFHVKQQDTEASASGRQHVHESILIQNLWFNKLHKMTFLIDTVSKSRRYFSKCAP